MTHQSTSKQATLPPARRANAMAANSARRWGRSFAPLRVTRWLPTLLWILGCLSSSVAAADTDSPDDLPLESRRYQVLISISFGTDPTFTPRFQKQVADDIRLISDRTFYKMWNRRIERNLANSVTSQADLRRLEPDTVLSDHPELAVDKAFFTWVESAGSQYVVSVREWDAATRRLGAVFTRHTPVRSRVGDAAMRAISAAFRPLLSIENVEEGTATLRLQAAAFPPSDPAAAQLNPGDILQAFLRYRDLDGTVARIQSLPWTYLVVDNVERERVTCTVASGLRAPLGGGRRQRRVDLLALATHVAYDSTRLELVQRTNTSLPLVGHQVRVVSKLLPEREAPQPSDLFVTDRRGTVQLRTRADGKLVWLYVLSGDSLLARVPYVPGSDPSVTLSVPDDSIRLSVEGELELLQGDLVDLVAARAQHILRARHLAADDHWDQVDVEMAELEQLPDISHFRQRLSTIRVPALEAARADQNRLAESRIGKLCDQMSQLIQRYVDDDKIQAAKERIQELRPRPEDGRPR